MSLRSFLRTHALSIVPAFAVCISSGAFAAEPRLQTPKVQTYVEQAVPMESQDAPSYMSGPLKPGALTLEDVLEAHRRVKPNDALQPPTTTATPSATATAPVLTPSAGSSTTGLMMSQGMKTVLQKSDPSIAASLPASGSLSAPLLPEQALATGKPKALAPGLTYEPGRAPRTLDALGAPAISVAEPDTTVPVSAPLYADAKTQLASQKCGHAVETWEKTCADAGYPSAYVGKVTGETRTGCGEGELQDFWVTNTCAPRVAAVDEKESKDGICGSASGEPSKVAPSSDLCHTGTPTAVKGKGPWTWSCKGGKKARSESCSAPVVAAAPAVSEPSVAEPMPAPAEALAAEKESLVESPLVAVEPRNEAEPNIVIHDTTPDGSFDAPTSEIVDTHAAALVANAHEEFCGTASETLASEAPVNGLCRVGTASAVNGDGPWTWSCTNNEGVVSSCRTLSLKKNASSNSKQTASESPSKSEASVKAAPRMRVEATPSSAKTLQQPAPSAPKASLKKEEALRKQPAAKLAPTPAPAPTGKVTSAPSSSAAPFAATPTPTHVPEEAEVVSDKAPPAAPDLAEGADATPPALKETTPPVPVIKKPATTTPASGGRLTLDPTVSTILFSKGSGVVEQNVLTTLNKLVGNLQKYPDARISLTAYADSAGSSPREAHRLSLTRALAVRDYLSAHGIDESRVDVSAQGADGADGYMDRVDVKVNE